MVHLDDPPTFEEMYRERLDDLGVSAVHELLTMCVERANNERLVMLCYEDLTKPGLRCHRRIFAAWYQEHTGESVPELEPAVGQERLFQ
jgi:hypothetical protein